MIGVSEVLYHPHTEGKKLHERLKSSPLSDCPNIIVSPRLMHPSSFLVSPPPSFINLGMRFLLRGRAVTPCVMVFPNYLH
jgi:hypothetical protein